jgi:hypothetical protein
MEGELTLLIHCRNLPGATFGERTAVRLGVQKGSAEVIDDVAGDTPSVTFTVPLRVKARRDATDQPDFGGPFAQGKPGERFVYLCWGERTAGGHWDGFRRAKLPLYALDRPRVLAALSSGRPIEVHIGMTDAKGAPVCATLRPEQLEWSV